MSQNSDIKNTTGPSRTAVWKMFDRIAHRYDLLNHLLSFGQDILWRRKMSRFLPQKEDIRLLDLATGTGDQVITLLKMNPAITRAIATDMAEKMIAVGVEKAKRLNLNGRLRYGTGDATALQFKDHSFDAVTISFGIRNVTDVGTALREMYRVLRPDGRALILEFSLPKNTLLRNLYLFYFRNILPGLGSVISGDKEAYYYLNRTVESFPYGDDFLRLMQKSGFETVFETPLSGGIATIYCGIKADTNS